MLLTTPYEEGSNDRPILVLAEAPSNQEIRLEQPLVGPSGAVFNDCLRTAGLRRSDCYILNIWPFQVEKSRMIGHEEEIYTRGNVGNYTQCLYTKKGFTELGIYEARQCIEKLKTAHCNVVLTLGKPALQIMTGDNRPIMKWRGSPLFSEKFQKKFIPTVHPAATLHGVYTWRYMIIADMEKVKGEMESPFLELPKRDIITNPTFDFVMQYMSVPRERFATDIEVINHQVNCFCICPDPAEVLVVPMADEFGDAWWTEDQEIQIWQLYAKLMGDPDIAKINQNIIGFDAPFLLQQNNIYTNGFIGDTMVAQKIMYPDFRKGLDFITSIHTREPYYKDEGKMWKGLGGDLEQFWRYNGKDGCVALESWDALAAEMTEGGYWPTYNRVMRLAKPIQYMTVRGMKVDHEALKRTHKDVEKKISEKQAELDSVAQVPFNVSSPKQCQNYFYGIKGITPYMSGKGTVTTDDKAMARIYRRYNLPEAKLVQEIRALRKLKGTYLEVDFDKDSRVRCSWDPTGTWTGRLSSSQTVFGTGMNMQNLHPEFKNFLVADDD